jgi:hypothetical protein
MNVKKAKLLRRVLFKTKKDRLHRHYLTLPSGQVICGGRKQRDNLRGVYQTMKKETK